MKLGKILFTILSLVVVLLMLIGCSGKSNSDGNSESITVHGDWKIEVMDPDGTLVSAYEFNNFLTNLGTEALASFLSRESTVGGWVICAGNTDVSQSPWYDPDDSETNYYGQIVEDESLPSKPYRFETLTVVKGGENDRQVILNGSAVAQRDGSIGQVLTEVQKRSNTLAPGISYYTAGIFPGWSFTQQNITPVSVSTGQYVSFTVILSFD